MANREGLLRKLAESEEIEIEALVSGSAGQSERHHSGGPAQGGCPGPTGGEQLGDPRVNAAYRAKYTERWPDSVKTVVRRSRLNTTLRLIAI